MLYLRKEQDSQRDKQKKSNIKSTSRKLNTNRIYKKDNNLNQTIKSSWIKRKLKIFNNKMLIEIFSNHK